ncbi:MAG TPA: DUF2330 domain-containing protein, partial [Gemmataceae bacterium]|nr:DUF2330 domain-containing protein [Gemmataceae bacterium]
MAKVNGRLLLVTALAAAVLGCLVPVPARAACCYFAAKDKDILQPAQKLFLTWDPQEKVESFTVQPKFEGNALDFGMVIPTPAKPKLDEMPRDFFKELAVFSILKKREQPQSNLLPRVEYAQKAPRGALGGDAAQGKDGAHRVSTVKVLEAGIVGNLDYKIIEAGRADDLYAWLKDNKYSFSGDEATLDFYIQKKWLFTVMKIDTMQMKRRPDGSFDGEVTPTRFQFASDKLVYPLKITQLSVKDKTEALFYVQAPYKVDLPGDMTYQYQWLPMIQNAQGWYAKGIFGSHELPGKADDWLKDAKDQIPALLQKGNDLGFNFVSGQRPQPNKQGRIATTLEWARLLTADDIKVLKGEAAYTEKVPDPDEGFTQADTKDPQKAEAVYKVIRERLDKYHKERPGGYLVREAPAEDLKQLKVLAGHLKEGQFLTKFRKTFSKAEMDDDLLLVPARLG